MARKIDKLTNADKETLYSPVETIAAVLVSSNAEELLFVVDSGASMHLLSKKDSISDERAPSRRSIDPTTVMTASEEMQTNEGAQVYVHDLDLVVTEQLLENTPAVISLGKLSRNTVRKGEWSPRSGSVTGGGEPARVQNLRVSEHPSELCGTHGERRANDRPAVVPSSRRSKYFQ